jgi:hypothetical protein
MSMTQTDQYGPAPASTASSPGSAAPAPQQAQAIPFVRASRRASQQDFAQSGLTLSASSQQIGPIDLQTNGFLRYLELYISQTTAGNAATVAFTQQGAFGVLQNVTLQDPSSEFIVSPFSGEELMLSEKYFEYAPSPFSDPRGDPNFLATAGAGATAGSFTTVLRVPLEDRMRDAFCAVPNSAANKNYRLQAFVAPSATIFTTPPTTPAPNLQVQVTNFYWTEPPSSIAGAATVATPTGNGSVAYLDREVFTAITAQSNPTLILKNVGRVYKSALFILRNAAGAREDVDWPNPTAIWVNGFPLYYKPTHTWLSEMSDNYGYGSGGQAKDTVGGLDTGVYAWYDLFAQPGVQTNWGPADQMLPTVPSTKIQLVGVWGATANSLTVLERTIKPSSGAALYG